MSDFLKTFKNIDKITSLVNTPALKIASEQWSSMLNLPEIKNIGVLQASMFNLPEIKNMGALQASMLNLPEIKNMGALQASMLNLPEIKNMGVLQTSMLNLPEFNATDVLQSAMLNSNGFKSMTELRSYITDMAAFTLKSAEGFQSTIDHMSMLNTSAIDNAMQLAMPSINSAAMLALKSFQENIDDHNEEKNLKSSLLDEVVGTLDTSKEFQILPDNSKSFLLHVYQKYIFNLLLNIIAGIIIVLNQAAIIEISEKFSTVDSPSDAKKLMKSPLLTGNSELLKEYRFTNVDKLRLREKPKMQSNVIEKLQIYTLVNVIDKSKRSWLYVQVEIEDEIIEGWIARKHTTYFK